MVYHGAAYPYMGGDHYLMKSSFFLSFQSSWVPALCCSHTARNWCFPILFLIHLSVKVLLPVSVLLVTLFPHSAALTTPKTMMSYASLTSSNVLCHVANSSPADTGHDENCQSFSEDSLTSTCDCIRQLLLRKQRHWIEPLTDDSGPCPWTLIIFPSCTFIAATEVYRLLVLIVNSFLLKFTAMKGITT